MQNLRSVMNPAIFCLCDLEHVIPLLLFLCYSSAALPACFYVLVTEVVNSWEECLSLLFWKAKQHTWLLLCQLKFQNPSLTCPSANLFMLSQLFVIPASPSVLPCFKSCRDIWGPRFWSQGKLHSSGLCHWQSALLFQACILMTVFNIYLFPELNKADIFSVTYIKKKSGKGKSLNEHSGLASLLLLFPNWIFHVKIVKLCWFMTALEEDNPFPRNFLIK